MRLCVPAKPPWKSGAAGRSGQPIRARLSCVPTDAGFESPRRPQKKPARFGAKNQNRHAGLKMLGPGLRPDPM